MLNVDVKQNGSPVTAQVVVGANQVGVHRMFLWDSNVENPAPVPRDENGKYQLGPAAALNQHVLSWEVRVAAATTSPEPYNVSIFLEQDGISRRIDSISGTMTLGVEIDGSARISAE